VGVVNNYLEEAVRLLQSKDRYLEAIERLNKMRGTYYDKNKERPCCHTVKFETEFGAHLHTNEPDLHVLLVDAALKYYSERLRNAEVLIGLMNEALKKVLADEKR